MDDKEGADLEAEVQDLKYRVEGQQQKNFPYHDYDETEEK